MAANRLLKEPDADECLFSSALGIERRLYLPQVRVAGTQREERNPGLALAYYLHCGILSGDVIREDNNVYGGAVNIAARISALSAPGEVLVSDTLRGLARTSAGVSFADRGEQALKGVGEAVRVWVVRESEA